MSNHQCLTVGDIARMKDAGVPTLLHCPACRRQHVDRGRWATTPHRTHLCEFCGSSWRPFPVATYGVAYVLGDDSGTDAPDVVYIEWAQVPVAFCEGRTKYHTRVPVVLID